MSGHKKYKKLRARMAANPNPTPEQRKKYEHLTAAYDAVIRLAELRKECGMMQADVAQEMGVSQPAISQVEEATDVHISTLSHYVAAMGGRLEVTVVFANDDGQEKREQLMPKRRVQGR